MPISNSEAIEIAVKHAMEHGIEISQTIVPTARLFCDKWQVTLGFDKDPDMIDSVDCLHVYVDPETANVVYRNQLNANVFQSLLAQGSTEAAQKHAIKNFDFVVQVSPFRIWDGKIPENKWCAVGIASYSIDELKLLDQLTELKEPIVIYVANLANVEEFDSQEKVKKKFHSDEDICQTPIFLKGNNGQIIEGPCSGYDAFAEVNKMMGYHCND